MSLMLGQLYSALKGAGASEEDARAAASEVAGYENRLATIEATQRLHSWMLGTLLAVCLTILFKVFS